MSTAITIASLLFVLRALNQLKKQKLTITNTTNNKTNTVSNKKSKFENVNLQRIHDQVQDLHTIAIKQVFGAFLTASAQQQFWFTNNNPLGVNIQQTGYKNVSYYTSPVNAAGAVGATDAGQPQLNFVLQPGSPISSQTIQGAIVLIDQYGGFVPIADANVSPDGTCTFTFYDSIPSINSKTTSVDFDNAFNDLRGSFQAWYPTPQQQYDGYPVVYIGMAWPNYNDCVTGNASGTQSMTINLNNPTSMMLLQDGGYDNLQLKFYVSTYETLNVPIEPSQKVSQTSQNFVQYNCSGECDSEDLLFSCMGRYVQFRVCLPVEFNTDGSLQSTPYWFLTKSPY